MPVELARTPLQPPIDETVGLTSHGTWSIGSLMTCQALKDGEDMPPDVVCTWSDSGVTYALRKRNVPRASRDSEGDFRTTRLKRVDLGLASAVWTLSPNIFCKVKSWIEGLTTEADTLRWVNQNVPSVPTEKVIYDWTDPEWNRTIMISHRVPGKSYQEAWSSLTPRQRLAVADQVASHFKALSENTSDYIETVMGTGLIGIWSLRVREAKPVWKPLVEPRVSRQDYEAYIRRRDGRAGVTLTAPNLGEPFVLQHFDCNPTNFFVTTPSEPELPEVTA